MHLSNCSVMPLILLYFLANGQSSQPNNCMLWIKNINYRLNNPTNFSNPTQTYYCHYQTKITLKIGRDYSTQTTGVKILLNKQQAQILSDEMSAYQDQQFGIWVDHRQKTIFWRDADPESFKAFRQAYALSMQDTLLKVARVLECKDIQHPKAQKQVTLGFDKAHEGMFPYNKLTYQIDTVRQMFHKIIAEYPSESPIKQVEVTFLEINYNYKTDALNKPVKSLFFDAKGKLLPKYKEYQLIDQRSKK